MPRLKKSELQAELDRQKEKEEEKKLMLKSNIKCKQEKLRISNDYMATMLQINVQVYCRKLRDPRLFTYLQLVKIFSVLRFSEAEILESI